MSPEEALAEARDQSAALIEVIQGELTKALKAEGDPSPSADRLSQVTAGAITLRLVFEPEFKPIMIYMLAACLVEKALSAPAQEVPGDDAAAAA